MEKSTSIRQKLIVASTDLELQFFNELDDIIYNRISVHTQGLRFRRYNYIMIYLLSNLSPYQCLYAPLNYKSAHAYLNDVQNTQIQYNII